MARRREILRKRGGIERKDDVEFTFEKGRWGHLGEATLTNRVKSHPDVGERWYPEILSKIRAEQGKKKAAVEQQQQSLSGRDDGVQGGANGSEGGIVARQEGVTV